MNTPVNIAEQRLLEAAVRSFPSAARLQELTEEALKNSVHKDIAMLQTRLLAAARNGRYLVRTPESAFVCADKVSEFLRSVGLRVSREVMPSSQIDSYGSYVVVVVSWARDAPIPDLTTLSVGDPVPM